MRDFIFGTFFFFLLFLVPELAAQSGCTDPQALNYQSGASTNDGSCTYPVTNYAPSVQATLPNDLQEISGLTLAGGRWWGHNDGGNPADFYRLLPATGALPQKIKVKNADNKDWEDITTDGTQLYLGDFGNNNNDRQNLGIYRLPLGAIGSDNTETVDDNEWTFLAFAYADQMDFSTQPEDSTEYDCEAMIYWNGALHLFTKNRKHRTTTHYLVHTDTGQAEPLETFDVQGDITGASLSPDGKLVILLGYDLVGVPKIFCWLLWDWHDGLLFNGNKRRLELGNVFTLGQAEAIGFGANRSGYIANERVVASGVTITPQRTYAFDVSAWVPEPVATQEPENADLRIFPNPFSQQVQLPALSTRSDGLRVFDAWGRLILTANSLEALSTASWPPGWYVFAFTTPSGVVISRGLKQE